VKSSPTKRRVLAILFGGLVLAIVAIAVWPGEREPEYKGHKLSWWLFINAPPRVTLTEQEYNEAVHKVGTNAIPFMLKRIRYEQPRWRKRLMVAYMKLPGELHWIWLADKIHGPDPDWTTHRFHTWFMVLGAEGAPAIPELIKIVQDPKIRTESRLLAMDWLRWIGPPARVALLSLRMLESDANPKVSSGAAFTVLAIDGTNGVSGDPHF
jgi:hypothetical protein